jgi:hypothetical protein
VVRFENLVLGDGTPGFTVWPAQVPDNRYATRDNGTEYFLSSSAAEGPLDSNDSRMQQTWLAGGRLYGALDTIANVAGNIVNYPAIAVLPSGKGVMAFTLVGGNHYPSAAYAPLSGGGNVGAVHIAGRGSAPRTASASTCSSTAPAATCGSPRSGSPSAAPSPSTWPTRPAAGPGARSATGPPTSAA